MRKVESLTDCELKVMKCIWDSDERLNLSTIFERINENSNKLWKPQTVSTFLARIVQKGFVSAERQSRTFVYNILVPEEQYKREEAKKFCQFWFKGNTDEAAAFLAGIDNCNLN